ncbi:unnamed protein product, partial [Thelazia callipaeda]|uniref:Ras-related protein Rab-21 n=1 Tax=Thelazia callipaeda TaxID=103827 RepID=A0A0N5CQ94_THECL
VGKSSIILRHSGAGFYNKITPTLGASFISSSFLLDGKSVELQIWDTAGQERYASMLPMYLRNALAAIIVYDITDRESFEGLKKWIDEVERCSMDPVSVFIVGNKLDLESNRSVHFKEASQYAKHIGAAFYETSALTGEGIRDVIVAVAKHLLERQSIQQNAASTQLSNFSTTKLSNNCQPKKFCCARS